MKKEQKSFNVLADFEDVAALFFDADKDGDLDLFVGSGGNKSPAFSQDYINRLYKNDGKGNFTIEAGAVPYSGTNVCVAVANDFDNDGDLDLFVGSRSVPQMYGKTPASFLLINDGTGKFTDIAQTKNRDIAGIGMVTGATWADVTGDKQKELIVAGEWMEPKVFSFKNNHFAEVKTNLEDLFGWWKTVAAADLDGDGDEDLVLGNLGENFYLHPDADKPVKMFIGDFDNNGTSEKIITQTISGKDKPVFLKGDIIDQIPSLRKQNLKYTDFAEKSIQDLFPGNVMQKCIVKKFNYSSSCIALNEGNGKFIIKKMPLEVQLSSVNAVKCSDINNDGKPDIILGGNDFSFLPQFSRLDASYGHVLLNKGKGEFEWINPKQSGIDIPGVIKDIVEIQEKDKRLFLFLQNNDYPVLYQLKTVGLKSGETTKNSKANKKV
ncbi:MAG: VCBS repeat-containing protein [Segetibacter sp.]